jgi:hypothetical protein
MSYCTKINDRFGLKEDKSGARIAPDIVRLER